MGIFDKVENEGGRASCQDNWDTFSKMRRSQYMAWPLPLLESWKSDLVRANEEGRNPHRKVRLHDVHQ